MDLSRLTPRQHAEIARRQHTHPGLGAEQIVLEAIKGAALRNATAPATAAQQQPQPGLAPAISATRAAIEQELQQARDRMAVSLREMEDIATAAASDGHGRSFMKSEQRIFDSCVRGFERAAQRVEELLGQLRLSS
jgi:hypothetical protein